MASNLHVPLKHNVLLGGLGLGAEQEKTAFWQGFKSKIDPAQLKPVAQEITKVLFTGDPNNLGKRKTTEKR